MGCLRLDCLAVAVVQVYVVRAGVLINQDRAWKVAELLVMPVCVLMTLASQLSRRRPLLCLRGLCSIACMRVALPISRERVTRLYFM